MGLGSRRQIDRWVIEGRITINGRAAKPGDQLTGDERVCVDGRPVKRALSRQTQPSFLLYYKPSGTSGRIEPTEKRPRGPDMPPPPKHGRWIGVGALDTNAAGLVLLMTDGSLANRLTRSRSAVEREYAVRLLGHPTPTQLQQLTDGIELEDGAALRVESLQSAGGTGSNVWYHAVLRDGGNRELRGLFDALGLAVSRLICVRYGPVKLGKLRRGQTRPLSRTEVDALYALVATPSARGRKKTA
jgi:23S rRNA pseudouridine2605 synthase